MNTHMWFAVPGLTEAHVPSSADVRSKSMLASALVASSFEQLLLQTPGMVREPRSFGAVGQWGDGAMGQWGDGAMGRWGDGAMGQWGNGAMAPVLPRSNAPVLVSGSNAPVLPRSRVPGLQRSNAPLIKTTVELPSTPSRPVGIVWEMHQLAEAIPVTATGQPSSTDITPHQLTRAVEPLLQLEQFLASIAEALPETQGPITLHVRSLSRYSPPPSSDSSRSTQLSSEQIPTLTKYTLVCATDADVPTVGAHQSVLQTATSRVFEGVEEPPVSALQVVTARQQGIVTPQQLVSSRPLTQISAAPPQPQTAQAAPQAQLAAQPPQVDRMESSVAQPSSSVASQEQRFQAAPQAPRPQPVTPSASAGIAPTEQAPTVVLPQADGAEQSVVDKPLGAVSPQVLQQIHLTLPRTEQRPFTLTWQTETSDGISAMAMTADEAADRWQAPGALGLPGIIGSPLARQLPESDLISPAVLAPTLRQLAELERHLTPVLAERFPPELPLSITVQGVPTQPSTLSAQIGYTSPAMMAVAEQLQPEVARALQEWAEAIRSPGQTLIQPTGITGAGGVWSQSVGPADLSEMPVPVSEASPGKEGMIDIGKQNSEIDTVNRENSPQRNPVGKQTRPWESMVNEGTQTTGMATSATIGNNLEARVERPRLSVQDIHQRLRSELGPPRTDGALHELEVELTPEHLGRLVIRITERGQALSVYLQVESQEARQILETDMALLRQELAAQGIQMSEVNVSLQDDGRRHQQMAWMREQMERRSTRRRSIEAPAAIPSTRSRYETRALNLLA